MAHVLKKTLKANAVDKDILELFWRLAEGSEASRITAVSELVTKLLQIQQQDDDATVLQYVLQRLVKGLGSGRKFARLGYSMALTQVLREFETITCEDVLQTSEKCLALKHNLTKSEAGNVTMGKAFVCLTLMQSGRLFKDSKKLVQKVVVQLEQLPKEKSYLHPICIRALSIIIATVNSKVFKKYVYPQLEKLFTKGWQTATPDDILLLDVCWQNQTDVITKDFIKEHWDHHPLICPKNYQHISRILMDSTMNFPQIHEIVDLIIKQVVSLELDLVTFWSEVVHNLFDGNYKRQHLGLTMFSKMLPHIRSAEEMRAVLSPDVVACLMKHTERKDDPLLAACKQVVAVLIEYVKSSNNRETEMAVFSSLICKPCTPATFGSQRLNILNSFLTNFCEETIKEIVTLLMSLANGKRMKQLPLEGDCSVWACSELSNLLRICTDFDVKVSVLQFLCLRAFFSVNMLSTTLKHCDVKPATDKNASASSISFSKSLTQMATIHPEKATKVQKFETYLHLLYEVIQYADKLIKSPDVVSMKNPFTEEAQAEWDKVIEVVNKMESDRKSQESSSIGLKEAFQLLYMFLALQMFTKADNVISIVADVHVCYKKASQRRRSMLKSSDDPHWMEVVTEVLVSLLSQNSNLTRVVTRTVFRALADHTTRDSLAVIIRAIQPKRVTDAEDDEDMLSFEDEEENVDAENMDTDSVSDNVENDDDDEEDDDEVDSDDENDKASDVEEVDTSFRQTVQAALGDAVDDDDDDESLPDLTDEQMFKLDDKLAEAFRSLRKGKSKEEKEKKEQIVTFKTRVMDLVDILASNPPSIGISVDLLQALLQVMESGDRLQEEQVLYNKATQCLADLWRQKKLTADDGVDKHNLFSVFQNLIQYSRKVTSMTMVTHISNACLFVISLLLNPQKGESTDPSPAKTRSHKSEPQKQKDYQAAVVELVQSSLSDLLYKKDHRLHAQFFDNMLKKHSKMFWPLWDTLLQVLQDDSVKLHSRTQACSLLTSLLSNLKVKELNHEIWEKFADQLATTLKEIILNLNVEKLKPMLVREVLTLTFRLSNLNRPAVSEICDNNVKEKLNILKAKLDTDTRRIFNKLYSQFPKEQQTNGEDHAEKKKKKKKHEKGNNGSDIASIPTKKKKIS